MVAVSLKKKPSKLFINIGTNDIRKWPDEDWYTHLKRNYGKICGIIRDRLGSAQVYMLAYYPVNPFVPGARKNPGLEVRTPEALERANGLVRELAEAYGFRYLDVNDGLKDERGCLKEEYTSDGMHFEPELYYTVFERLRPYLKQA